MQKYSTNLMMVFFISFALPLNCPFNAHRYDSMTSNMRCCVCWFFTIFNFSLCHTGFCNAQLFIYGCQLEIALQRTISHKRWSNIELDDLHRSNVRCELLVLLSSWNGIYRVKRANEQRGVNKESSEKFFQYILKGKQMLENVYWCNKIKWATA